VQLQEGTGEASESNMMEKLGYSFFAAALGFAVKWFLIKVKGMLYQILAYYQQQQQQQQQKRKNSKPKNTVRVQITNILSFRFRFTTAVIHDGSSLHQLSAMGFQQMALICFTL